MRWIFPTFRNPIATVLLVLFVWPITICLGALWLAAVALFLLVFLFAGMFGAWG